MTLLLRVHDAALEPGKAFFARARREVHPEGRTLHNGRRIAALLVAFAFAVPWLLAGSAAQAASPTITVSPARELTSGQYVTVTWANLDPGFPIYMRQCPVNPSSVKVCEQDVRTAGVADTDGGGSLVFPVESPWINPDAKGEPTKNSVKCDSKHACTIALFLDDFATNVRTAVYGRIQFEPSQSACPDGGLPAEGEGAAAPFRAVLRWEGKICTASDPVDLNYVLKTSVDGMQDFDNNLTPFSATTIPFSAVKDENGDPQKPPDGANLGYAPLTESGMVFGYRAFDHEPFGVTGDQITSLKLTPALLAKIFTGQIGTWDDPAILALNPQFDPSVNPGHGLPPNIRVYGRADACDETYLLTSWFETVAKTPYEAGGAVFGDEGVTTTFPSTGNATLVTGATALAQQVSFASDNNDPYSYGFIGYMDSSTAQQFGLRTVKIQNQAGQFVDATPATIAAAMSHMKVKDGVLQPDLQTTDPNAYPLPVVSYAIARQNVPDGVTWDADTGKGLKTFLNYVATDGQKDLPDGYVPLNKTLAAQTLDVAKGVPTTGGTTTPPPTTPPPTPDGPGGTPAGIGASTQATASDPIESTGTPTDGPTEIALPPNATAPGVGLVAATTRMLLPFLLVVMLGALLIGPVLMWFGKRRAAATAGAGGASKAASTGGLASRLRMPGGRSK